LPLPNTLKGAILVPQLPGNPGNVGFRALIDAPRKRLYFSRDYGSQWRPRARRFFDDCDSVMPRIGGRRAAVRWQQTPEDPRDLP
jgi:hypothetical protein